MTAARLGRIGETQHETGRETLRRLHVRACSGAWGLCSLREAMSQLSVVSELPPSIFVTAFGSEAVHEGAARLGAAAIFDKPFDIDDLLEKARGTVRSREARTAARKQ